LWRPYGEVYIKEEGRLIMINFNEFEVLTLSCLGTLIDWEKGLLKAVRPLFTHQDIVIGDQYFLKTFLQHESDMLQGEYVPYREIIKRILLKIGQTHGFVPTYAEIEEIIRSTREWRPFPDVTESLKTLKQQYKLAIISNLDRALFEEVSEQFLVEFDWIFTADEVRSYKPSSKIFNYALENMEIPPSKILHIGHSLVHDIIPAKSLKLSTVWVNRATLQKGSPLLHSPPVDPDLEVPDLKTLISITS